MRCSHGQRQPNRGTGSAASPILGIARSLKRLIDLMRPPDAMLLRRTWEGMPIAALLENHLPAWVFCVWGPEDHRSKRHKVRRLE